MSGILDSAMVRESVFPVSLDFYHEAGKMGWISEDVELLEGIIVRKMSKSPLHESLVRILGCLLREKLPDGFYVAKEGPISHHNSEPEPDLSVLPGDELEVRLEHPATAELVVEVSVSTREKDRGKAAIYAAADVPEYWLVDAESRQVERYTRPDPTRREYLRKEIVPETDSLRSSRFPEIEIELTGFFPNPEEREG